MIRKFSLTLAVITAASLSIANAQQTEKVTASGIGYLEYLPPGYHASSEKFPLVISLHGIREKGTASTDRQRVLADLHRVDNVGLPKYVKYGKKYPFILISPQLKSNYGSWPPAFIMEVIRHVRKYLRIDDRRIYLTGLSLGGLGVWKTAGEYPDVFAAIAPICPGGNALNKAHAIAAKNVATWGFHGGADKIVHYSVTTKMVNAMNAAPRRPNPLAKATIFPGMGHIIWDKAYNNTDLLDWMLRHRKGSAPSGGHDDGSEDNDENKSDEASSNKQPVVRAGADRTLTLPANSTRLQGTATDSDGKIVSYHWRKISGGAASLGGANTPRLTASNLREGTYVFRLTARDNDGASRSDDVRVIVRKAARNQNAAPDQKKTSSRNSLPVVSAGPDRVLTLPANSITIQGTATDKDGRIISYEWAKTYGNQARLAGARSSRVTISNLTPGVYIFRLRATDNDGGVKDDYFKITVNRGSAASRNDDKQNASSGKGNRAPYVYAGPDRVLTMPTNSITIQARASDSDGRIVSYQWAKTYGNQATLSGARTSRVRISNLAPGVYIFRLTVQDNDGGVKHDYFKISVNREKVAVHHGNVRRKNGNARPVAYAGVDRKVSVSRESITLRGSARDDDGRIVSYRWKKLSGPPVTIRNASSPQATIADLKEGHYYFSLTVEDDDQATHVDKMALRVTGS